MEPRIAMQLKLQPAPLPAVGGVTQQPARGADELWARLKRAELSKQKARRNRIVVDRSEPAQASFGVLRTKVLRSLALNNWTTVAVTSPEPGCGKSVVAMNLAFTMANLSNCRVALLDLDFRRPQISTILGMGPDEVRPTAAFLQGRCPIEAAFVRYGNNLAVSAGKAAISLPAELLQSQTAQAAVRQIREQLSPGVILIDMPPVLGSDDVLAFLPNVDCTLLVVGAGLTTIAQVRRCEQELAHETNLLGMVLNKCRYGQSSGYY